MHIYFLLHNKKVVYIGKSERYISRLSIHYKSIEFNAVRVITCNDEMADYYERRWIKLFKPKCNVSGHPAVLLISHSIKLKHSSWIKKNMVAIKRAVNNNQLSCVAAKMRKDLGYSPRTTTTDIECIIRKYVGLP